MKVIIIKDCKDGKVNDIVEVKDGYGKNFLIRNGFALPVNNKNSSIRNKQVSQINKENVKKHENSLSVKEALENITLEFKLKEADGHVHGSVSKKQILHELKRKGIIIDSHSISSDKINTMGLKQIDIKIDKETIAKLKVEVVNG